ncbi:hypothetical protein [Beggiatoa leptomitoformis]|uniref:Uncharacterized protein n=1 Tax=Beggiatoa leptomitoformis TaxID=288004 RepID=A0A2N9YCV0_9GAMM|nr:hypothetical protein [Beggiatoa leptomitoformis]ALG66416.1 hypothetical protein AL038_00010 [Beggiatoa leptomitoformis]AUI68308.1 hypothetical protein BLE401_06060 [Beggiatoa leptomitoformis]
MSTVKTPRLKTSKVSTLRKYLCRSELDDLIKHGIFKVVNGELDYDQTNWKVIDKNVRRGDIFLCLFESDELVPVIVKDNQFVNLDILVCLNLKDRMSGREEKVFRMSLEKLIASGKKLLPQ